MTVIIAVLLLLLIVGLLFGREAAQLVFVICGVLVGVGFIGLGVMLILIHKDPGVSTFVDIAGVISAAIGVGLFALIRKLRGEA